MFGKGVIKMTAPEIEKLQKPAEFQSDQEFTLDPKRGLFLIAPSQIGTSLHRACRFSSKYNEMQKVETAKSL